MLDVLDTARISGTDYEEFKKQNAELAEATGSMVVYGRDITFLSLCDIGEYQQEDSTVWWMLSDAALRDFRKYNSPLKLAKLYNKDYPAQCLNELRQTTGLMMFINEEKYMVSQLAMPTLTMQASVAGNMTINRANFLRDMHLADAIFFKNEPMTLVYRTIEVDGIEVKKVLAVFATAYREVKQTIVSKIADSIKEDEVMGSASVKNWEIDHELTQISMQYPKITDTYGKEYGVDVLTPGVMIRTSDIGRSAITVYGTQQLRRGYVITDEITAKHTKKNEDSDQIVAQVDEKIFFNHRRLPELLGQLIGMEATDYTKLSSEAYEDVCNIVEEAIAKLLKGVLAKRHILSLTDSAKNELVEGVHYTLYDIAIMIMELSERIKGLDDSTMLYVRKALAKTPEVLKTVVDTSLYLTA